MKYDVNDFYPNVAFGFKIEVKKCVKTKKFFWDAKLHVQGPDEIFNRESALFETKQLATENMLIRAKDLFVEMMNEGGEL